jgi:hypothetical protein
MARLLPLLTPLLLLVCGPVAATNAQAAGTAAWVHQQVVKLTSQDVMVRKAARDALVREAARAGAAATYLKDLDDALVPLAKSHTVRERITAGVVAEQVASETPSAALEGVTQALMASDSDATALLGTKVARALLPATVTLPRDALSAAVVSCVKAHPDSGEIAGEAYAALTLRGMRKDGAPPAGVIAAAVPAVLDMLELRISQYGERTAPKPAADGSVTMFLAIDAWPAVSNSAPTRSRILRDLGDLLCVQARAAADGNADRPLAEARRQAGQALQVTGGPALQPATESLMKLLDTVAPDEVDRRCAALDAAMPPGAKLTRAKR